MERLHRFLPPGGYTAKLAIYLHVAWAALHPDARFDWDVASNDVGGGFLRDFVFNAGTTPEGYEGPPGFVINASTNATRGSSYPSNPCPPPSASPNSCRTPAYITASGWYTFVHEFSDGGESGLRVDMSILDSSAKMVASWTIYPGDPMATVGGNRYGWFANQEINGLPIDDSSIELGDTIAPTTTIDSAPPALSASADASFTFSGADADGSGLGSFECRLDSEDPEAWQVCTSPQAYSGLADGTHRFEVRAIDLVGNPDQSPATFSWNIDTPPPTRTEPPVSPSFLSVLAPSTLSPPKFARTVNAQLVSGTVRVKLKGSRGFRVLKEGEQIPVGSILDTRNGRVRLTSAKSRDGSETQTADFYAGVFRVLQPSSGWPRTVLKLVDRLGRRQLARARGALASRRRNRGGGRGNRHRRGNGLWGDGRGNFVSRGQYGAAAVRGTIWFTQDRPDGTFFKVRKDKVLVRDFTRRRRILLRAGQSYLAPAH